MRPDRLGRRSKRSHDEHSGLTPPVADIDHDRKEVDLSRVAGAVAQRHVDLGLLGALLTQPVLHHRQPDLVVFADQLRVQPPGYDPPLAGRPAAPLLSEGHPPYRLTLDKNLVSDCMRLTRFQDLLPSGFVNFGRSASPVAEGWRWVIFSPLAGSIF